MFENVSGSWKEITSPYENVSGTWKNITGGWENVSGVWKQFYVRLSLFLNNPNRIDVNTAVGVLDVQRGGVAQANSDSGDANTFGWVDDGAFAEVGDDFEVRLVAVSGTNPNAGESLNTWLTINTLRRWRWDISPSSGILFEGTMTIRDIATSGGDFEVSTTVNLNLSRF
jgi:hypothetical protein